MLRNWCSFNDEIEADHCHQFWRAILFSAPHRHIRPPAILVTQFLTDRTYKITMILIPNDRTNWLRKLKFCHLLNIHLSNAEHLNQCQLQLHSWNCRALTYEYDINAFVYVRKWFNQSWNIVRRTNFCASEFDSLNFKMKYLVIVSVVWSLFDFLDDFSVGFPFHQFKMHFKLDAFVGDVLYLVFTGTAAGLWTQSSLVPNKLRNRSDH